MGNLKILIGSYLYHLDNPEKLIDIANKITALQETQFHKDKIKQLILALKVPTDLLQLMIRESKTTGDPVTALQSQISDNGDCSELLHKHSMLIGWYLCNMDKPPVRKKN